MPGERLPEVCGLRPHEEVVLVQDLLLGEPRVLVRVGLEDEVLGLGLAVVEVGRDDPVADLNKIKLQMVHLGH